MCDSLSVRWTLVSFPMKGSDPLVSLRRSLTGPPWDVGISWVILIRPFFVFVSLFFINTQCHPLIPDNSPSSLVKSFSFPSLLLRPPGSSVFRKVYPTSLRYMSFVTGNSWGLFPSKPPRTVSPDRSDSLSYSGKIFCFLFFVQVLPLLSRCHPSVSGRLLPDFSLMAFSTSSPRSYGSLRKVFKLVSLSTFWPVFDLYL